MANGGDQHWLTEWLGAAATTLGAAAVGVGSWVTRQYHRDRTRLANLETRTVHLDDRVNTLASAVDDVIERQDRAEATQNSHSVLLAEIKTDVSWIRRLLESEK